MCALTMAARSLPLATTSQRSAPLRRAAPLTGLFGGAEGVELRAPMAITVICGLTFSTLLTLFVIPVIYSFSDRRA